MMDKLAHDAYSQGAYDALQQMDIPDNIKIAAAQHLTKTAGVGKAIGDFILGAKRAQGLTTQGVQVQNVLKGNPSALTPQQITNLAARQARALQGGGLATLGTAGGLGYAGGMFDEDEPVVAPPPPPEPEPEPELGMMGQMGEYGSNFLERAQKGELTNAEIAALAGTGALGVGGLAYGLS